MTQPPDGVQPQAPSSTAPGADVIARFIAKIVDGVVLFVIMSLVTMIVRPMLPGPRGFFTPGIGLTGLGIATIVLSVISAAIYVAYLSLLETSRGQTIGKMVMKLRVVGPDGGNPSMQAALRRNAWVLLSIIPWFGGLLQVAVAAYIGYTIYDSSDNVGWHDNFAGGTRVIKIG
ncbi:MAG: RDD family protein [Nitriliruptoraceae bacterium]